jgi:hypothetical protein
MMKIIFVLFSFALLMAVMPLWPQNASSAPAQRDEQLSFVGLRLDDVFKRFGSPQSVYAARGIEDWQDDVVFTYNEGDFYIYRDRVWQVGIKSVYGIKVGDSKAVAMLVFGENARDESDYVLYPVPGGAWPLSIRVNCNAGKVSAIYVFRPDY